jgi:hypothetical protein
MLKYKDLDTIYLDTKDTARNELYYHFNNDVRTELAFNFDALIADKIRAYFGGKEMLLNNISFRRASLICDFISSLCTGKESNVCSDLLLDHPHKGLLRVDEDRKLIKY